MENIWVRRIYIEYTYNVRRAYIVLIFFTLTFQFPETTIALSPTVFPRFVSVCLFILSLILLLQGIKKQVTESEQSNNIQFNKAFVFRFILMVTVAIFYLLIINKTGYLVATPIFIAGSMLIFNEKKLYRIILVSVVTTFILYFVFRIIFRVPLPRFLFW